MSAKIDNSRKETEVVNETLTPEKKPSLYSNVIKQFNKAADLMDLDPDIRKILQTTNNEITIHFPVKMDDKSVRVF